MNLKNVLIVSLLMLAILTIGAVSAADDFSDDNLGLEDQDIVSIDDSAVEATNDNLGLIDSSSVDENDDVIKESSNEVLSTPPKTFTQLNETINGNEDSDVYLDGNYTFELGTDTAFKDGVVVGRAVTVHGNGFTISGDNAARIFSVTNSSAVFMDIVFVDGKTTLNGGAICGECSVVNCSFNGNNASSRGGALYECSAVNCTFVNNSAYDGGAVTYGSAVNCSFNGNNASNFGGAIYGEGYSASGCNFTNNSAYNGGAMYGGVAINSNFTSNHANNSGGAVYDVIVANCLFEYNDATDGGAMIKGKATNCTFNNNNASNFGGAVYDAKVSTNSQFNDNLALNGTGTDNVSWFEPVNAKSFTDLNELINNNTDSDVYLNDNYTFDLSSDLAFMDGVVVGRAVTIHGNDFTISGDNAARIFNVTNSSAVFMDIVFVDGKTAGNGSAIYGQCSVVNCSFYGNNASNSGGALYYGSAVNCSFVNNSAGFKGGALYNGSAVNCSFVNNSASSYGGALYNGSAVNCTFTNNNASYGGAFYSLGSVVNCTFTNNSASGSGGAMNGGSAVNCTFINNTAHTSGGAVYGSSSLVNCTFTNNSADCGGALYGEDYYPASGCIFTGNFARKGGAICGECNVVVNCSFNGNNASEYGGAMYGGDAWDCIFKGNIAGIDGNNTYGTDVRSPVLTVSNYSSTYGSGGKLVINFTTLSGNPIDDANITIRVYKNNSLIGTYHCLSGKGWVVSCGAGNYYALLSVENQAYDANPVNATLKIAKASTKITSSAVTATYSVSKNLVATLKDSKGKAISGVKLTIKLSNGKSYTKTTNKSGQVKLGISNLVPKTYTATITFAGNSNYAKYTKSVKVTVKKATPKLTAKAKTFKVKVKTKKYAVTLKTNKGKVMKSTKLTLKVNGKTFSAKTNSKGVATFKITNLKKKGTFKATIKYAGSKYYNKLSKTVKITVKK